MSLNKSAGNMYEWVSGTWNPLAGACPHACTYCSTNKLKRFPKIKEKYSGEPRLDHSAMKKNLGSGKTWFVVGQNDLFAKDIPAELILEVLRVCRKFENNKYLFQTKNPKRVMEFVMCLPSKTIVCTTIETNRINPQMGNTPSPQERAEGLSNLYSEPQMEYVDGKLYKNFCVDLFLTIEPIMDFDLPEFVELIKSCNASQVNIGGDSKRNNLPEPSKEKVLALISELEKFTVIHNKHNIDRLIK